MDGQAGDQPAEDAAAVPVDSIGFWADRLERLNFKHPCGIDYTIVGDPEPDSREPYDGGGVSAEHAIRGAYGIRGTHHLTFCVGGAQEDYDFHVRLLGLKSVKKTVLFDSRPTISSAAGSAPGPKPVPI